MIRVLLVLCGSLLSVVGWPSGLNQAALLAEQFPRRAWVAVFDCGMVEPRAGLELWHSRRLPAEFHGPSRPHESFACGNE